MILSRVFTTAFVIFLLASIVAYFLIDIRPLRERALEAIDKKDYFHVLKIYHDEKGLEEEDHALISLAVSGIEKKINLTASESDKNELIEKLNDYHEVPHTEYKVDGKICTHLEDPFFLRLKKHAYWYQKSLLEKVHSSIFCNPPDKNSEYLNRILFEDPRNFMKDTSIALVELFQSPLDPIGEIESGFLIETIHFLATEESSPFYNNLFHIKGDRVNFRFGAGTEYPVLGQLNSDDELYCFDRDSNEETLGGKQGFWIRCFSPKLFKSGWVFSPQTQIHKPSQMLVERCKSRFSTLEYFAQIDFDTWREESIPLYFFGDYIPTKRKVRHGEVGFTVYRPQDGKKELICRKFSGKKNFFEVFYEIDSAEESVPIAEFHVLYGGQSHPAFKIEVGDNNIILNGNNFLVDSPSVRETLSLKITGGKENYFLGTLIRKNSGILQNVKSLPLDSNVLEKGTYSWEICIPQAVKKTNHSAILYGFRIGKE
ncbi:hypothetical protein [Leptospira sp. GIMC2001]|uniref:hypothetical protein n=1 Tax=Leptospira sp. GIMC2001 TaxID=1513297 RepID=UPI00234BB894|nr:hypothetical protein [Leptospira sp. GIMC2001]WCL51177.1 hypothetical protein O4O04_10310 [Leptospira sp. GIMC2001]